MSTTDELLASAGEESTVSFHKGDPPMPPARKVAIVACMDARLNPTACSASAKAMCT